MIVQPEEEEGAMPQNQNIQDTFLNHARKDKTQLTIFLTNGFQFKGLVRAYDSFTVILESEGRQHLVYKHAISTIIPVSAVRYTEDD